MQLRRKRQTHELRARIEQHWLPPPAIKSYLPPIFGEMLAQRDIWAGPVPLNRFSIDFPHMQGRSPRRLWRSGRLRSPLSPTRACRILHSPRWRPLMSLRTQRFSSDWPAGNGRSQNAMHERRLVHCLRRVRHKARGPPPRRGPRRSLSAARRSHARAAAKRTARPTPQSQSAIHRWPRIAPAQKLR